MANELSPGVTVQIINESFYGSPGNGTIPLVVVATAANKTAASGTSLAPYTVPSNAGKLFLAASQRELLANFGNPTFATIQGTPVHGDELNEYGLHAAYSYLGIANQCYVLRADLDTAQLAPSTSAPRQPPTNGTYWFDLNATRFGLFRANGSALPGSAWVAQTVKVPAYNMVDAVTFFPLTSFGSNGDFAVVPWTASNFFFEKIAGVWYQIGTANWLAKRPTVATGSVNPVAVTVGNSITINGTAVTFNAPGTLASVVSDITAAFSSAGVTTIVASIANNALMIKDNAGTPLVISNTTGHALNVLGLISNSSDNSRTVDSAKVFRNANAAWPDGSVAGSLWVKGNPANQGANWVIRYYDSVAGFTAVTATFVQFDSTKPDGDVTKDANATLTLGVPSAGTIYIGFDPVTGVQEIRRYSASGWSQLQENPQGSVFEPLEYEAGFVAPSSDPLDGTLWYDAVPSVDIMVGDGQQWMGYRRMFPSTDKFGAILSGSAPTAQVGGHTVLNSSLVETTVYNLVDNDIWIDTSDLENYPMIYRYSATAFRWTLVDKTDHTTPFGIVFADARMDSGITFSGISNAGTYAYESTLSADLALSDFVDPDVVPADAHPSGTLLFNTRYSTGNVKIWHPNYFKNGGYDPTTDYTATGYQAGSQLVSFPAVQDSGRWVTASGNNPHTLAPYMLRKAQRTMVVRALTAAINDNQQIRSEVAFFNLIACPGYAELLPEMHALNIDQKEVSFVVADTPIRLASSATAIQAWATNANNVIADGEDGLVTAYEFAGAYYPWGLGQDQAGNEVMIPPSTIALRTMAYNDQVAYQWFAPAGFQRGLVTNATSVGYLGADGTYQPTILNQGQRDVLYTNKINPIAYIPGRGLVVYGQKTLAPVSSALDRINVARLVNYIRYNLDIIVKPYLFEQNDASTQKSAKNTVERFYNSLVGLRAISDYAVLCDKSNNTVDRVNRNELWIDSAILPLKAVEFIIMPVRVQNGATASINVN